MIRHLMHCESWNRLHDSIEGIRILAKHCEKWNRLNGSSESICIIAKGGTKKG